MGPPHSGQNLPEVRQDGKAIDGEEMQSVRWIKVYRLNGLVPWFLPAGGWRRAPGVGQVRGWSARGGLPASGGGDSDPVLSALRPPVGEGRLPGRVGKGF